MSIITESKTTKRLTVLFVIIMGVAMIIPSNIAIASSEDDNGSTDGESEEQDQEEQTDSESEEQDQEEQIDTTEELPPIDEELIDPCLEDPNAAGCETEPADPCLLNPDLPECIEEDPCLLNPDLPECAPPMPCPDGGDPLADDSCPPIPCPVGEPGCPPPPICLDSGDPLHDGPPKCGPGTHLKDGICLPNKKNGGSSSSSSSSSSTTTITNAAEASSCRLDGNAHGIQQKFDMAKYRACGVYPNGQIAYTDGFVAGCTQVGNTPQLCQAFIVMNTQQTQIATSTQPQIEPISQSTTLPTQTQPIPQSTQAIQPAAVS